LPEPSARTFLGEFTADFTRPLYLRVQAEATPSPNRATDCSVSGLHSRKTITFATMCEGARGSILLTSRTSILGPLVPASPGKPAYFILKPRKPLGHRGSQSSDAEIKTTIQDAKYSVSKRRLETKLPPTLGAPSVSVSEPLRLRSGPEPVEGLCALCGPCLGWARCEIFRLGFHFDHDLHFDGGVFRQARHRHGRPRVFARFAKTATKRSLAPLITAGLSAKPFTALTYPPT